MAGLCTWRTAGMRFVPRRSISQLVLIGSLVCAPGVLRAGSPGAGVNSPAKLFAQGRRLFGEGDYVGAAEAFGQAYQARPHFSVLCNIALCHERRADFIEAARYYRRCLRDGAENGANADEVRGSLARARARIAVLAVSTPNRVATIYLDGRRLGPSPLEVTVNPGSHVVEARSDVGMPVARPVLTRGGERLDVVIALQKEPQAIAARSSAVPTRPKPRGGRRTRPGSGERRD